MTATDNTTVPDYMQDYESFWKPLISNADGSLNEDQIARELADYRDLMRNASEVYCAGPASASEK